MKKGAMEVHVMQKFIDGGHPALKSEKKSYGGSRPQL
jgi:hypothetical protein